MSSAQIGTTVLRRSVPKYVGQPVKRKEDLALITGHGRYVDDVKLSDMLFAAFVRSTYAHARIRNVNLTPALETPGVVFAIAGGEVAKHSKPLPLIVSLPSMKRTDVFMLAVDKVHFSGQAVAAVVAEDRYTAEDAAEKVQVDLEPLECVNDAEKALETGAPRLYDNWDNNEMLQYPFKIGDPEGALQKSDFVIKERITRHRYTGAPIEPRGYVAHYDPYTEFLTYYASVQTPHIFRSLIAESLDIPEDKVRVIAPHVGGGFGVKIPLYQEEPLIGYLSMRTGKPVKWIETRSENLRAAAHSRQQIHYVEVGVNKDGTITALRDEMIADLGAYGPQSGLASVLATTLFIPSGYRIENYEMNLHVVHTNKSPYGAVRGFGKADANFVMERMLNIVARRIGMDPVELRMKNFIKPHEFPYITCTGAIYDSGNYPGNLRKAVEAIGYSEFRKAQPDMWKKGIKKGISVVFMIEPSANAVPDSFHTGYDSATIRIDPSGKISVLAGVCSQGQGHETAISQIVADELGVNPNQVTVLEGDTAVSPYGLGAWASRFAIAGAGAVISACQKIRTKLIKVAAYQLGLPEEDLVLEDGHLRSLTDAGKSISTAEVAEIAYKKIYLLPAGVEPTLEETARYVLPNIRYVPDEKGRLNLYPSVTSGAYGVIVELDIETGGVKVDKQVFVSDCGNIINPLTLDGQIQGGIATGIGGAMLEDLPYDSNGQLLASTFMDYLIPTSMDVPSDVQIIHMVTPSPISLGGFKGAAEGGAIPPPYAIANAVEDALTPFDITLLKQPLSLENVWKAAKESSEHQT